MESEFILGRMKKFLLLVLVLATHFAFADSLEPFSFVKLVTDNDGDTVASQQVSVGVCPGLSCPTLLSAAITNKTNRRRTFINVSGFNVFIGSNTTTLATTGFLLTPSSGTYTTHSTAAFYAVATTTATIGVLQELNSNP